MADSLMLHNESDNYAAVSFPTTPINRIVGSEAIFDIANRWLSECVSHSAESMHRLCPSPERSNFVPKRLLKISSANKKISIKLYQTREEDRLRYCCLSYC